MVVVVVSKQKQLYDASRTSFRARNIHRCLSARQSCAGVPAGWRPASPLWLQPRCHSLQRDHGIDRRWGFLSPSPQVLELI